MTLSVSSLLLLITNGSLTLLSIYWSATAWTTLRVAQREPKWQQHMCIVVNSTLEQHEATFCPVIIVTNFSQPPTETTASFGLDGDNQCSTNETEARIVTDTYAVGKSIRCWLSPITPGVVSLLPILTGVQSEDVNLAAISTVLAVAATLSLAAITFLLCVPQPVYVLPDILTTPTAAVAPVVTREGLSRNAVDAVLQAAEEADANCSHVATVDSVCAICLEEGLGARLSCNHAFHSHCIRAWLQRGGETCPLCCAAVRPPPGFVDSPVTELSPEDSDATTEEETPAMVTTARESRTLAPPEDPHMDINNVDNTYVPPVRNEMALNIRPSSHRPLPYARQTFLHLPTAFASAVRSSTSASLPADLTQMETINSAGSSAVSLSQARSRPPSLPLTRSATLPPDTNNELRDDPDAFMFAFDLITERVVGQGGHESRPSFHESIHVVDEELVSDDGFKEGACNQTDDDDNDDYSDGTGASPIGSAATEEKDSTPRRDSKNGGDGSPDPPLN